MIFKDKGITEKLTDRNSGVELLRIVLIIAIIAIHIVGHGGALDKLTTNDFNYYTAYMIESLFISAVNCFIIVSGYFGLKFSLRKILKIEMMVLFYSVGIYLIFCLFGFEKISLIEIIKASMPVSLIRWWFITVYILLYLLSPFLNILIEKLDRRQHRIFILIMMFFFSVIPTLTNISIGMDRGYGLYNFILLYFIGSYLKKYNEEEEKINSKKMFFLLFLVATGVIFISNYLQQKYLGKIHFNYFNYNNIFVIFQAILIFKIFKSVDIKSNLINYISKFTLAVYLIHDHPNIRKVLYSLIKTESFLYKKIYVIHLIGCVITIYIICVLIEIFRKNILNRLENKLIYKIEKNESVN